MVIDGVLSPVFVASIIAGKEFRMTENPWRNREISCPLRQFIAVGPRRVWQLFCRIRKELCQFLQGCDGSNGERQDVGKTIQGLGNLSQAFVTF
jgi:hypothetical protein